MTHVGFLHNHSCTWICWKPDLFYQSNSNNCSKFKAVKSRCPFSRHLRPILGNVFWSPEGWFDLNGNRKFCLFTPPWSTRGLIRPFTLLWMIKYTFMFNLGKEDEKSVRWIVKMRQGGIVPLQSKFNGHTVVWRANIPHNLPTRTCVFFTVFLTIYYLETDCTAYSRIRI